MSRRRENFLRAHNPGVHTPKVSCISDGRSATVPARAQHIFKLHMLKFFVVFLVVLLVLFRIDMLEDVQRLAVEPWAGMLAWASAGLMALWDSDVMHHGKILTSKVTGFAVSIEAGCNGVEAAIVLIAGTVAYPSTWKQKAIGIAIGIVAVQSVNLIRIISLYYLGNWNMQVFEFAHLYLWQALIMLDVLVVWMLWIRWVANRQAKPTKASCAA